MTHTDNSKHMLGIRHDFFPLPNPEFGTLPKTVQFVFDKKRLTPLLIDTGADVSVIPRCLCKPYDEIEASEPIILKGISGKLVSTGTITCKLDLDLGEDFHHKFFVVDLKMTHMIAGVDFMITNQLYPILHRKVFVHEKTGRSCSLRSLSSLPEFYPDVLCESNNQSVINKSLIETKSVKSPPPLLMIVDAERAKMIENKCFQILYEFPRIIAEPDYTSPAKHKHHLDVEVFDSYKPTQQRARPCSVADMRDVEEYSSDLTRKGALKQGTYSGSTTVSPITIARKKDGSPRICVDYTKLNAKTVDINHPLPRIQSLTQKLTGKHRWFSVLDLREAYYSLPLTARASRLAAIITHKGVYVPLRTPFGLKNAPAKFCELVADLISGLESFVFAYIDDFIVYSETLEDHYKHLRKLFTRFDDFGMFINTKKCLFAKQEVKFLGYKISTQGMGTLDDKVSAVSQMPPPTTVTEVRRFLGSMTYYRAFLPNIAEVIAPISNLLKGPKKPKKSKIEWEAVHQHAYEATIKALCEATYLSFEDPDSPLVLTTDASLSHAGAVLEQVSLGKDHSEMKPLAFFSQAFPRSKMARSVFGRELTALYLAVKHFKYRLRGRKLIVRTDHSPLVKAVNNGVGMGEHSLHEERYIQYIKDYQPAMIYIKGEENVIADFLSRPNQFYMNETNLSSKQADSDVETPPCIASLVTDKEDVSNGPPTPTLIAEMQAEESQLVEKVRQLSASPSSNFQVVERRVTNGLILYGTESSDLQIFRAIVPTKLRMCVFNNLHTIVHEGKEKSIEIVSANYFWPNMASDIALWTRACPQCQSCKISRHNRQRLVNYPQNYSRFHTIHVDLVGPLDDSEGFRFILTMRDRGTGYLITAPLTDKSAMTVTDALSHHLIGKFGVPVEIISDNGREFVSHVFKDFCRSMGIIHKTITAYHPQAQGIIERVHRTLKTSFRALDDSSTWPSCLPLATLSINNLLCDNNSFTPHQQTFGQPGRLPGILADPDGSFSSQIDCSQTEAFMGAMSFHRRSARPLPERSYLEKDIFTTKKVWVRNEASKSTLEPLYTGPYVVIKRSEKYFSILKNGIERVSIDRLKVAFELPNECDYDESVNGEEHVESLSSDSEAESAPTVPKRHHYNLRSSS